MPQTLTHRVVCFWLWFPGLGFCGSAPEVCRCFKVEKMWARAGSVTSSTISSNVVSSFVIILTTIGVIFVMITVVLAIVVLILHQRLIITIMIAVCITNITQQNHNRNRDNQIHNRGPAGCPAGSQVISAKPCEPTCRSE